MMGRRPNSTLDQHSIVIEMVTAGLMNKHIASHFKLLSVRYPVLEPRSVIRIVSKIDNRPTDHVRPPGERTLTM